MASITRKEVAAEVHESLDNLAFDFTIEGDGVKTEGDYYYPIEETLRDCGFDAITDADTHAKIRAVVRGTTYYALSRAYRKRAAEITTQMGAGASGTHLQFDPSTALGSLRLHLSEVADKYEQALQAIGIFLDVDPEGTTGVAQVVTIDDEDSKSGVLVDSTYGLPWYEEGYHEWSPT
jgi:hypothetical protein